MSVLRFLFSSVLGRIFATLILLGIGGVYLLLSGSDGERPKSEEKQIAEQIERSTEGLESTADSAELGLQVYRAETALMVGGDPDRYRVRRLERSEDGDLNVFTGLPFNTASKRKVAKLCEKLIGGDPPLVEVKDFVFVFGQGLEHIRADECDIRFWEPAAGSR